MLVCDALRICDETDCQIRRLVKVRRALSACLDSLHNFLSARSFEVFHRVSVRCGDRADGQSKFLLRWRRVFALIGLLMLE